MSTKEKLEAVVETMGRWQKLENATVAQTAKIMGETDNPLIRLTMEIIQRDSNLHYRVQQLIIDSITREQINVPVDELSRIWTSIEKHIEMERKTIELASQSLEALGGTKNVVQQYLLSYLMEDEKKHDKMLSALELIKKHMYP